MSYGNIKNMDFDHSDIIYNIAKTTGCTSYLELGLYKGSTINKINNIVPYCVGVDILPVDITGKFFLGTTDDFFKMNKDTFDLIFIDADHKFVSVKKDFNNSLKILNKYGIIFLHDTDPISVEYTDDKYCGDSYRIIDYIQNNEEFNLVTLPVLEAGLTIVNRKSDRRVYEYKGLWI